MKDSSDSTSPHLLSPEISDLLGTSVAIELPMGNSSRVVRGVIVEVKQEDGSTVRIALEDPDGKGGSPVLIVPNAELEPDARYGCDYFLGLFGGDSAPPPAETN